MQNRAKTVLVIAGIAGALSVMIGAFGAHGLQSTLEANDRADTFETAAQYQFYHSLALLLLGVLMLKLEHRFLIYAAYAFIAGIFVFSGSLYALSITDVGIFGAITPFGGLFFIVGWLLLALGVYKSKG